MLTFLIIVFTVLISKEEPDVHHHYYGSLGEGQAHHHYGETVTGKTLSSDKKDSSGLRNFPLQPVDDYEDGTSAPSSNGSSGGSSTEAPGSGSEDWEEDAEIREMSLSMLSQLLRHKPAQAEQSSNQNGGVSKEVILQHKDHIGSLGVKRIQEIRNLKEGSEEREYATLELEEWEALMVALAEAGHWA